MSLASKLDSTKTVIREALPPATFAAIDQSIADLRLTGLADRAVGIGDLIALPILRTIDGLPVDLADTAAGRPVVLVFYRGGWCPYCNTTLRAYAEALPRIEAAGGTLIAVTPEQPGRAFETARSNDVRFAVVVDDGNRFAKSLGLVFALPVELRPLYREVGIDLPAYNGDDSHDLPIPATYVLAPGGRVTFAHVDPDFTRRADPDEVVAALDRLDTVTPDHAKIAADPAALWNSIR